MHIPGTRVSLPGPVTCLLRPSHCGCPSPRSATWAASPVARAEKAATLGSDRRWGTRCGPRGRSCDVLVPAKRGSTSSCLQPNPKPVITPGTPSGHTSQQPARAPNKECRGFQTPGSNLSALAPEWLPGWRSCHKLPRPLSAAAASQPPRRGAEEGGEGPGKDAELMGDPSGERFHPASRLRRAPFRQPGSGTHGEALPFPVCSAPFGLFESPFLFRRGHTADLKEFVPPGSARQVCWCAHTLRMNGIFESPIPGAPLIRPAHPSGLRLSAMVSEDPCHWGPRPWAPGRPNKGRRGWVLQRSLDRFRKEKHRDKSTSREVQKERQRSRTHSGMGAGAAVAVECGPETRSSSPGGSAASDFRGGGFCLLCRRRRSCGCRGS